MRDEHYKSSCDYQFEYDTVIDLIKRENVHCNRMAEKEREEFACKVVNDCIRSVIYGDAGMWSSTGGCIAVRVSNKPDMPGYKKVVLAFRP